MYTSCSSSTNISFCISGLKISLGPLSSRSMSRWPRIPLTVCGLLGLYGRHIFLAP